MTIDRLLSRRARLRIPGPETVPVRHAGVSCRLPLLMLLAFAAHGASAHALDEASEAPLSTWSFEPWVIACLALSAGLYAIGLSRLWRRAGRGRGVRRRSAWHFAAGWLTLVVALVSPVDGLGSVLFSAHMVQHELLMIVAAPLLVLGQPLAAWVWALSPSWRSRLGSFFHRPAWRGPWLALTAPISAWVLHALALWLWHVPVLFDAALASEAIHTLQHISFLGTALVFWWSILGAATRRERGIGLLSLFTTMVHTGALGALLTLSGSVWYRGYASGAGAYGLTALEDQQLGGIIMWVPAGFVYVICGLVLSSRWLREPRRASS